MSVASSSTIGLATLSLQFIFALAVSEVSPGLARVVHSDCSKSSPAHTQDLRYVRLQQNTPVGFVDATARSGCSADSDCPFIGQQHDV